MLDGRFETISPLNHGSFGMVFQAKDLLTGELVAIKCLTKTYAANNCPSAFAVDENSEELAIHFRIGSHPNIVNLIHSFETTNHVYLVLEFCSNGDLYEAIRLGKGPLETQRVRDFMLQLVDGFFVRPLLLPGLAQLRLEVVDRIGLFLDRLHPPLHELDLDGGLLDVLVL